MPSPEQHLERLIGSGRGGRPLRVWSLMVTLFGDAILPRGGSLWLSSLTQIMALLSIEPGAVRTALSRLLKDQWVERAKTGRNAYYRLSTEATKASLEAACLIYRKSDIAFGDWDGEFHLALIDSGAEHATETREELARQEFRPLTATVSISLRTPKPSSVLTPDRALVFSARTDGDAQHRIAERAFGVSRAAASFVRFESDFAPILADIRPATLRPGPALALRILTIHALRSIVLKTQILPEELLPENWPGNTVRRIAADLYGLLAQPSEAWLDQNAKAEAGPLPAPEIDVAKRFKGM